MFSNISDISIMHYWPSTEHHQEYIFQCVCIEIYELHLNTETKNCIEFQIFNFVVIHIKKSSQRSVAIVIY